MIIVYDKANKKVINNMGTNSAFPDGIIPNLPELPSGQVYIRLYDNSDDVKNIMSASAYEVELDDKNELKCIVITKTKEQARIDYEASNEYKKKQILKELVELDIEIPRIVEDIIEQGKFIVHQNKTHKINRKKELRQELQNLGG